MRQSGSAEPPATSPTRVDDAHTPPSGPPPVLEVCAHLESRGLAAALHGEALLDTLRPPVRGPVDDARPPLPAVLCAGDPAGVLRALPRAVVTAEGGARLVQQTEAGPVDVLCLGPGLLDDALPRFALAPLAIAFRPATEAWLDPAGQRSGFAAGRLALATVSPESDPFREAPRRYWLAARLMAEYALEADAELVEVARKTFGDVVSRLPQGAPARRALSRVLMSDDPAPALAFLDRVGVTAEVAPGAQPINAARLARLERSPALRWAAWLRGAATARAMVTFRMPHALARRVERLQASHPLDRASEGGREAGLRRTLSRLTPEEIDALVGWRRIELDETPDRAHAAQASDRLDRLVERIARERQKAEEGRRVRTLALDGAAVMARLDAGPGRHVGLALAHLARVIADDPEANVPARLEAALDAWAAENPALLSRDGAPGGTTIG